MSTIRIIAIVTLVLVAALALNLTPSLRGPDSWRWAYAIPGVPWRHGVPAAAVTGYCAAVILAWRSLSRPRVAGTRRSHLALVLFAAAATPVLQLALLYPESPDVLRPLFYRTISPGASGVFTVGSHIDDLTQFLRAYPALMPTFPVHPQRYPPGLPVLFYLARQALALAPVLAARLGMALRPYQCHDLALMRFPDVTLASAVVQMALPALAGLTILPLYKLAQEVAGRRAALLAVGLYPLVPSLALWSARWDQAYPLLTCTVWALFALGLKRERWGWMVASGLCLSAASFLSFGTVVMLMPLGLWALLQAATGPRGWRGLGDAVRGPYPRLAVAFALGLALPWGLYQLAFGSGFADIWRVSMSYHLGLARDYWVWLGYHLYDFLLFLGIPIAALFLLGLATGAKRVRGLTPAVAFTLAVGGSLLLLDLSGMAQGEVARVWLFLTPFPAIVAAVTLARLETTAPRPGALSPAILGLLAIQLLVFNAVLRVVTTGVTDPPVIETAAHAPVPAYTASAELDGEMALLGYDVGTAQPGATLPVTLTWQALGPIPHSYTVFTHLTGPDGHLLAQHDGLPQQGQAPTTCWRPGTTLLDVHELPLPPDLAPGSYELTTGLYRYETGERLPLRGAAVTPDAVIVLGTIRLNASETPLE